MTDKLVERIAREVVERSPVPAYPYNLYIPVTDAVRTTLQSQAKEIERLRGALTVIANGNSAELDGRPHDYARGWNAARFGMRALARTALEAKG